MQDKKALVRVYDFFLLPVFYKTEYEPRQGTAHILVTKNGICKVFLCQFIKKILRLNIYNFRIVFVL